MSNYLPFAGICILVACSYVVIGNPASDISRLVPFEISPKLVLAGSYQNKLYFMEPVNVTWTVANKTCVDNSMTLVRVHTEAELEYLHTNLNYTGRYYWTDAQDKREFRYGDNSSIATINPNGASFDNCAMLSASSHKYYRQACSREYTPLCEIITGSTELIN